ncbi:MAG: hypothetical protein ACOY0T_25320 [Myxococcota bacterium]
MRNDDKLSSSESLVHGWRKPARSLALSSVIVVVGHTLLGCSSSDHLCTLELRSAVTVSISSPNGLPVSPVTVTNETEAECQLTQGAGSNALTYSCYEQGGGLYTVRVTSGSTTWTKSVSVAADECHVTEQKTVSFVLDPALAD